MLTEQMKTELNRLRMEWELASWALLEAEKAHRAGSIRIDELMAKATASDAAWTAYSRRTIEHAFTVADGDLGAF